MKDYLKKVMGQNNLSAEESRQVMELMFSGGASQIQTAAFLTALAIKGETPIELAAFAQVLRDYSERIDPNIDGRLVDVCGTGGDMMKTFNISTTSMFIIAASGAYVAKHGNRGVTSRSGSADVLEALGLDLSLSAETIVSMIEKIGIGFMFAPMHHPLMKNVMPVRRELGISTVFNLLGPLANPACAHAQLLGIFDPDGTQTMAEVLNKLGVQEALVVCGSPRLDEVSTLGKTKISHLKDKKIETYFIRPEDYGMQTSRPNDLMGGSPAENAGLLKAILAGQETGPKRDIVLLNAAAGLMVSGKAGDLGEGLSLAEDLVESGKAYKKLTEFIDFAK